MATLKFDTYGKTGVRLTCVKRDGKRHEVRELNVQVFFEGDFEETYRTGDNRQVLPTDTIKNTVYVLARKLKWDSIESLSRGLAGHFLDAVSNLHQVRVEISEIPWARISNHPAAFFQSGTARRKTELIATRSGTTCKSGFKNLQILKTANSGFSGYIKDEYTTLAETSDRLFGTVLEADWIYRAQGIDFNESYDAILSALLECFAEHNSLSVQQTLFAMGKAILERFDLIEEIHLVMPNKHCLLVDLTKFGLDNPNRIFIPTDDPSGYIEARVGR
jgi:urate oxidase